MTSQNEPAGPRPLRAVPDDGYTDWEAVYQDNADWVYRTLFARVGNRADAEDLTAEVFLAALRPLRLTASVGEVRAYLRTTARTVLAAHWRETLGREITSIEEDIEQPPDSEEAISNAPARVAHVLESLPDRYRQILELRFLQGNSIKESAAELGISVANAKVLQHRALRLAAQVNDGGQS
ncbi:RNA polymerase sigma factor, sigma-70 family protein [Mycobacterium lentiflavum]|uniref:RNA polymerase sigma factor, sigma-70 family protein n=1 Tax=Mycobacterium lentiflavum TaxID=141349 RepID=A0A0E4GVR2_MYCLN|nr:sigma-70 family RNA polymerase sigma factor [Mycobacterium lentiflavum]MEE3067639.1 sigma-70 family RNA polymerase sigma factor [Actinomycetota bacterium]ULP43363.1 sigma-70 family RNA polymerase sigma factor [Mycobacterium lentiflavum]CQD06865.1 RNA polymerase sigma factor, sigma-70 family protein [Mycobacterium lentiflavum]